MRCNLRCAFCYAGELLNLEGERLRELSLDSLRRAFPDRAGLNVSLTGGEVFVRKDLLDILNLFRQKGYTCGFLTTNGTLVDETQADALANLALAGFLRHVSVSIDGPNDSHDKARGLRGSFERAVLGLRRLQRAARGKHAPLRVSITTTVTRESLGTLDRMAEVATDLGVDTIGLNHLMFGTPGEVAETVRLTDAPSAAALSTFVTVDPGVSPGQVREKTAALAAKCLERNIRFDHRPKITAALIDAYYTPGATLEGRCLYPFQQARVSSSGKAYFCPFIRIEIGDVTQSPLEEIWNSRTAVALRRQLLAYGLFPVCRRCCKVELRVPA